MNTTNPAPKLIEALAAIQDARAIACEASQSASESELPALAELDEAAARSEAIIIGALARDGERRKKAKESAI